MFKVGDKVIIKTKEDSFFIGGIHNHMTDGTFEKIFNKNKIDVNISRHYQNVLIGKIILMGKYNHYVINGNDNLNYVFNNDYDEMTILVEVSNEIYKKRF